MLSYTQILGSLQKAINNKDKRLVTKILCETDAFLRAHIDIYDMLADLVFQTALSAESEEELGIFEILYAFSGKTLPIYYPYYFDPMEGAQPIPDPITYSEAVWKIASKEAEQLKQAILEQVKFENAQEQLFILTGQKPDIYTGLISKQTHGKHLRFFGFSSTTDPQYETLLAVLQYLGFTVFSIQKKQEETIQFGLTFNPENFEKLDNFFTGKSIIPCPLDFSLLPPSHILAIFHFMHSAKHVDEVLKRNNGTYSPELLAANIAQYVSKDNPWNTQPHPLHYSSSYTPLHAASSLQPHADIMADMRPTKKLRTLKN